MKIVTKVALIALLWILVVNPGTIDGDTSLRLRMAHAWWTGTEEVAPNFQPQVRGQLGAGVQGVGGRRYIAYDVGQSMLMLPGDWLGTQLHRWFPNLTSEVLRHLTVNWLIFVPLNVAAVVACFWLLRLFEFSDRIAGLTSIFWLISTTVLHYAQFPQQNNQVLLFVTVGYAAALACVHRRSPRFAIFSGLALGAALLIRMSSIIHVFTVFVFLVGCIAYQSRDKFKILQSVGFWIVGLMPLTLVGRICDYLRYGSFWTTGQSLSQEQLNTEPLFARFPEFPANYPFIHPPSFGIWGVLFSPAKSIFIYDPLLLPCLVLGIVLWKRFSPYIQWYLITGIFNFGLHLVLTSRVDFWHGDAAWGARYHVTSVHLLLMPLLAVFLQYLLSAKGLTVWLMRGIVTIAILAQIASVVLLFTVESGQGMLVASESRYVQFRLAQRVTNILCLLDNSPSASFFCKLSPDGGQSLKSQNQFAILPLNYVRFRFNRKLILMGWGLILVLALGMTVRFCLAIA
jgi:hypothetical protein